MKQNSLSDSSALSYGPLCCFIGCVIQRNKKQGQVLSKVEDNISPRQGQTFSFLLNFNSKCKTTDRTPNSASHV